MRSPRPRSPLVGALLLMLLTAGAGPSTADEVSRLSVSLVDGRTYLANLDPRSDQQQMLLLWSRGGIRLVREVQWDQVSQVQLGDEVLSRSEFQQVVSAWAARRGPLPAKLTRIVMHGKASPASIAVPPTVPESVPPAGPPERVSSLQIEASLGRWGSTVEPDGLLVRIWPLDDEGRLVACHGTLEVELTGEAAGIVRPDNPFSSLGRWVEPVRPNHFGPEGAVYRLPFQWVHPEFDQRVQPWGMVHARLDVPGQGTFDASMGTVRLRTASPVRDRLQQATGVRYFPQERTRDGRR